MKSAAILLLAAASLCAQNKPNWDGWQFLIGEWTGEGEGPSDWVVLVTRRGVTLATGAFVTTLSQTLAPAAVPVASGRKKRRLPRTAR